VTHTLSYNPDGTLQAADGFQITREVQTARVAQISDGVLAGAIGYNGFGEPVSLSWKVAGKEVYKAAVTYRKDGRLATKSEAVGGESHQFAYGYDALGRLTEVKRDGVVTEAYAYDAVSNRTSALSPALAPAPVPATFDADDRMTQQGPLGVSHDANGYVTQVENAATGGTTLLQYAADGRLRKLTAEDGAVVEYLHDAMGTRVARKVDGLLDRVYVADGPGSLLAVLDAAGKVEASFRYAGLPVPLAMDKGGQTYYLVADLHLGMRLAVTPQGAIAQKVDYDAYGNPLSVLDPDFEMYFGFGGGISEFGVVKLGQRDYLPKLGRWSSRDPVAPASGFNQYAYAGCDPVNSVDLSGLWEVSGGLGAGAHGDLKVGYSQGQGWVTVCVGLGGGASVGVDFLKKPPVNLGNKKQAVQFYVEGEASATIPALFSIAATAGLYGAAGCDEAKFELGGTGEAFMTEFANASKKYGMESGWNDSEFELGLKKNYSEDVFGDGGKNALKFGASAKVAGCMTYQRRLR
jgi:RHS repeat-associated protein